MSYHRLPADEPLPRGQRYSKPEIMELCEKARNFVSYRDIAECTSLVRDKSNEYYGHIKKRRHNIMEPYIKDNHGDPKNPTNANVKVKGLFFNTYETPNSIYGNKRFTIHPDDLLGVVPNIYFADFYCISSNGRPHYVQLVLTAPGSTTDRYCKRHLEKLKLNDRNNNPFFYQRHGNYYVRHDNDLWVELFVTEDIDLDLGEVSELRAQRGQTFPRNPCRKNPNCSSCNLDDMMESTLTRFRDMRF